MTENSSPQVATAVIIAKLVEVRDERRRLAERDKELVAEGRKWEADLLIRLDEQGMLKATTGAGTASITETVVPQVTDWDALYAHIQETGEFYLMQKRPAAAAYRELQDSGIDVPGVEPFTKRTISLRKK